METAGGGIFGRLAEKVLGWVALGALILLGVAIYQTPAATKAAIWSGIWRTVAWCVIVAALPWACRWFIGRVIDAGSNWAGVALIGALTAMNVVAALLLMTMWPSGVWTWLLSFGALVLAGSYNYLVCEYLAETSGR